NNLLFVSAFVVVFSINHADAQRFKGSAVFGLNFSQIDGDDLAGFSKLGWTGGFKLAYPLKKNVDLNIEMLYSQRGSTAGFGFGGGNNNFTDLKYIELPVYVNIMDWLIEDESYYKAKAHAGLMYAYLFDVNSVSGLLSDDIDNYERHNVGYVLGVDYAFNSKLGLTVRYTRAFNSIYVVRAINYFVTVRTEYTF
ncbi:MAG: outer membrane beta-barrel protein, partial [Bacteroidota bacterium]